MFNGIMKTEELAEAGANFLLKLRAYVATGNVFTDTLTHLEEALCLILGGESREDLRRNIDALIFAINEPCERPEYVTDEWLMENETWDIVWGLLDSKLFTLKELKF